MMPLPVSFSAAVTGIALATTLAFASAWNWQADRYEARIARTEAAHQADLANLANAASRRSVQLLERLQAAEQSRAVLDQRFQQEKTDALRQNETLRAAVADGARRLRVAGHCQSGYATQVPDTAGTPGMGDAATVELTPGAGRNLLDIRAGIIADQSALRALQAYVQAVCH